MEAKKYFFMSFVYFMTQYNLRQFQEETFIFENSGYPSKQFIRNKLQSITKEEDSNICLLCLVEWSKEQYMSYIYKD
jgi:hypothetical protein